MAKTISFQGSLQISGDGVSASLTKSVSATQAGNDFTAESQLVGTSAEALDIGSDIGTTGYVMLINQDATNYVEIGLENTVVSQNFAKLRAGEFCIIPVSTGTLYAKANTAGCIVSKLFIEL